jgi:hypothetical protein
MDLSSFLDLIETKGTTIRIASTWKDKKQPEEMFRIK